MAQSHALRIRHIEQLTHDVRRYVIDRPSGYEFQPGQATEVNLDRDGWRDESRPFTFTSLPDDDVLEFTIKSYPDHSGVTEQIGQLEVGDNLVIHDAWGAIHDNGPGVFIAGGAGVTPFIAILRTRLRDGDLEGCHLIFSNKTEADIILREEFEAMPGLQTTFLVTDQPSSELSSGRLDAEMIDGLVDDFEQQFYVCGPPEMVSAVRAALEDLGANPDEVTFEE
ncbi:MAG: flavodoxin reductase [Acidimicrobiales bacterium]|nr:flavodoxin reductase [Acidimicrobiales bacterium]